MAYVSHRHAVNVGIGSYRCGITHLATSLVSSSVQAQPVQLCETACRSLCSTKRSAGGLPAYKHTSQSGRPPRESGLCRSDPQGCVGEGDRPGVISFLVPSCIPGMLLPVWGVEYIDVSSVECTPSRSLSMSQGYWGITRPCIDFQQAFETTDLTKKRLQVSLGESGKAVPPNGGAET